jgi:hypothetical protein
MKIVGIVALGAAAFLMTGGLVAGSVQAQERLRPVGEITFEPDPQPAEKGEFKLAGRDQRIRAFKIEVDNGSAEIRDVRIIYADGGRERARVRQTLNEGQSTSLIRLQDEEPVAAIEVTYVPRGAVTLILQGEVRRREPVAAQWDELGCKTVGFLGDRDTLEVSAAGVYRALRIRSQRFDIELNQLGITYGNGARDNYAVNKILPANTQTNEIPLRGEARRIRNIEFLYSSRVLSNKKPIVCVDGLRVASLDDEE